MKRISIIVGILLLCAVTMESIQAQPPGDRVEAMKVSFITTELALTPEEAQKFWPVFNKFEEERKALRQQYKMGGPGQQNLTFMSDAEALAFINNQIEFEQKELDITKGAIAEFKKILPVKKVAQLMTVEHKFKRMIVERYKGQQGGQK